eukprot:9668868-Alexandrium_andersonii.AAC.1
MSASLVGSEMCIRDRCKLLRSAASGSCDLFERSSKPVSGSLEGAPGSFCLLYTSDAADDM